MSARTRSVRRRSYRTTALTTAAMLTAGLLASVAFVEPAAAATSNPAGSAGNRRNATRLSFPVSATTGLTVDVGSGNALLTDQLLTLPGVVNDVPITLSWNSTVAGTSVHSNVSNKDGAGWVITGFDQRVTTNSDKSVSTSVRVALPAFSTAPAPATATTRPRSSSAPIWRRRPRATR